MAPKARGKQAPAEQPASPAAFLARPATPNDFQIVAAVKALQELVNVETKWKNRLTAAGHADLTVTAKIRRLEGFIDHCKKGISQVDADVDHVVDDFFNMVSPDPAVIAQWHAAQMAPGYATSAIAHVPPQMLAAATAPPPGAKGSAAGSAGLGITSPIKGGGAAGGAPVATIVDPLTSFVPPANAAQILAQMPAAFLERRRSQKAAIRTIVMAYYNLPRLAREERRLPRPTSPVEMQREFDEVGRLSTPPAEAAQILAARAAAVTSPAGKPTGGALGKQQSIVAAAAARNEKKKGASGRAAPALRSPTHDTPEEAIEKAVEELGFDLAPLDVLSLPIPRGVDARLIQRVLQLRSRRLRLEASMNLFAKEMQPLRDRLRCVAEMRAVGQYSLVAVQPQIAGMTDQELALQKVRQVEDDIFRKTAQTPPPTKPGQRRGDHGGGL